MRSRNRYEPTPWERQEQSRQAREGASASSVSYTSPPQVAISPTRSRYVWETRASSYTTYKGDDWEAQLLKRKAQKEKEEAAKKAAGDQRRHLPTEEKRRIICMEIRDEAIASDKLVKRGVAGDVGWFPLCKHWMDESNFRRKFSAKWIAMHGKYDEYGYETEVRYGSFVYRMYLSFFRFNYNRLYSIQRFTTTEYDMPYTERETLFKFSYVFESAYSHNQSNYHMQDVRERIHRQWEV